MSFDSTLFSPDVFGTEIPADVFGGIPPENVHVNVHVTVPVEADGSLSSETVNDLHDTLAGVPQENVHVNFYGTEQATARTFDDMPTYSSFDELPKYTPLI